LDDVCLEGEAAEPMTVEKRRKPRVERILRKRAPLAVENTKKLLLLKGHHTSQAINDVLSDLVSIATPSSPRLTDRREG
jgi:hypothetical protein